MTYCSAHVLDQDVVVYILSTILTMDTFYHDDSISSLKSHVSNSNILSSIVTSMYIWNAKVYSGDLLQC